MAGTPEEKIVWAEGGLLQRVADLESEVKLVGNADTTGGGGGTPTPSVPGIPTNLAVDSQTIFVDDDGNHPVAVKLTWDGDATMYEIAVAKRQ